MTNTEKLDEILTILRKQEKRHHESFPDIQKMPKHEFKGTDALEAIAGNKKND